MTSWRVLTLATSLMCLWSAHGHPASTTETLVITRDDGDITTSEAEVSSTEGPTPPVEMTQMDVSSEVALRYAHTAVVARVRNPARRAQETTFHVLLPETAFISGFTMTLDGKSYKAYVKDKDEAKDIYNAAVSQGVGTALVSAKARDSNHFTVSVNVEPNTEAIFNLTYEELLERRSGVYHHTINLNAGALVPQMTVRVHIKETQRITTLRVPELRSGNEIDASEKDAQNTNVVIVRSENEREATVTFSPDLEEQRRLMAVYAEKTRASHYDSENRRWLRSVEHDHDQEVGALGQFVVQYDVDRSVNGEILVNNGYFVHFFAPNSLPLPKHVVFVLDTSYSMVGHKLEQLKEAMLSILSELSPDDYFDIVEFQTNVKIHDLSEVDSPTSPMPYYSHYRSARRTVTLKCPSSATPSNIEKAKTIIRRLTVDGATNIYDALDTAINLISRGVDAPANGTCATGRATNELASTTSASSEDYQRPTPIIIFLTDGAPNVGVSNTQSIVSHITERNAGEDADRTFLRKLSLRNEGFMRHIYEAADAALQLRDFYRQVASPLLSNVRFTYPPEQVIENSLTTHALHSFYKGSEVVVAGRLVSGQPVEFEPTVEGFGIIDDSRKKRTFRLQQKASAGAQDLPLERLWAYLTVKQLLDKRDAADAGANRDSLKQRALSIALRTSSKWPEGTGSANGAKVRKPFRVTTTRKITKIAIGIWSVNLRERSLGAETVSGLGVQTAGSPEYVAGTALHNFTAAARRTLRGTPHTHTRAEPDTPYEFVTPLTSLVVVKPNATSAVNAESADKPANPPVYPRAGLSGTFHFGSAPGTPVMKSLLRYGSTRHHSYPASGGHAFRTAAVQSTDVPLNLIPSSIAPTSTSTTEVPTTPSPLAAYRLEDYPWARGLIDAPSDTLRLRLGNGTEISLRLAKDRQDEPEGAGEECAPSAAGGAGACTYLGRCAAARALTALSYARLYCVRDGYAGVCCPTASNSEPTASQ
ncbi:Inter-alpha-trypsin inhibitor heavy chain H3 [Eumeta japonica]|uniref:Inter-alpha-trypsin inhibitor heavy chain H3 n=1 Tax=Eumeta variegata TaxID=151549 RepID=A0A4C1VS27_EUMVA|nr:Inter-alpha-trypsin inhibitor heavy chain H3 [Eumeta japonica]